MYFDYSNSVFSGTKKNRPFIYPSQLSVGAFADDSGAAIIVRRGESR